MMAAGERSPGSKLLLCLLAGFALTIPLFATYALVWDRQQQSETARASIAAGWGGAQTVAGPVLVIPYTRSEVETTTENGRQTSRTVEVERELFLSPRQNAVESSIAPERRRRAIYETVLFQVGITGRAQFALPVDLAQYGVSPERMHLDRAEIRFGVSDARGLLSDNVVKVNDVVVPLQPGKGLLATGNSGFFSFFDWRAADMRPLEVDYHFGLRGNGRLTLVPRGGQTDWTVRSRWPHPSFAGDFLPVERKVGDAGFTARYAISNLALGQALLLTDDVRPPVSADPPYPAMTDRATGDAGVSQAASVGLVELVDPYSQVNRAIKYGFLFVGFTFLAFLMFDVVGGARVAAAEYLLAGSGLVLFFVLLLAFAEIIGFTPAYLVAGGAITGLLTGYSAAVLKSWVRARIIAGLLAGLYAVLYVLLNLEAYSLLIGSLLLFVALAGVMWATRRIEWSNVSTASVAADTAS